MLFMAFMVKKSRRKSALAGLGVCLLALAIFLPSLSGELVWEDRLNLIETTGWREALSPAWWLGSRTGGDWKPLVWAGYALEYRLWGLNPFGYRMGNLFLHGLNALLVYLLLRRLAGAEIPGAVLGALFWALHPLRVESVAWITERKDVQFTFFYLLAVWAWGHYRRNSSRGWYLAAWLAGLASLLSKAMAVTLPLVLILLDWQRERPRRNLLRDKIPFLVPAFLAALAAVSAQVSRGALTPLTELSWAGRVGLIAVSAVFYLFKTLFPLGLHPVYTLGDPPAFLEGAISAAVLGYLGLALLRSRNPSRVSVLGWGWYFLSWLPVSGVLRTGLTSVADRFSYLPAVGLSLVLVPFLFRFPLRRSGLPAAAVLGCLALLTLRQEGRWRDNLSLWSPLRESRSPVPAYNLGNELERRGRTEEARILYLEAIGKDARHSSAHFNLANLLEKTGDEAGAERHFRLALEANPAALEARINLGNLLFRGGRPEEALEEFKSALVSNPGRLDARGNLANTLASLGRIEEALVEYRILLEADPGAAGTWFNLGYTLETAGRTGEAASAYRRALALDPGHRAARRNLELLNNNRLKAED